MRNNLMTSTETNDMFPILPAKRATMVKDQSDEVTARGILGEIREEARLLLQCGAEGFAAESARQIIRLCDEADKALQGPEVVAQLEASLKMIGGAK